MITVFEIFVAFLALNLFFWILLLVMLNKRYSSEKILGKIKGELDQIEFSFVQRAGEITDDFSRQRRELKTMMRQIDERMSAFRQESEKRAQAASVEEKLRGQSLVLQSRAKPQNSSVSSDVPNKESPSLAGGLAKAATASQAQAADEPDEATRIVRLFETGFDKAEIAEKLGLPPMQVELVLNASKMRRKT